MFLWKLNILYVKFTNQIQGVTIRFQKEIFPYLNLLSTVILPKRHQTEEKAITP